MHGSSPGSIPVALSGYGGLVTLVDQTALPEGASPRTHDTDFDVGIVKSLAGLTNVYTNVNSSVGPNGPTAASSTTWLNPTNILANDGSYTSQSPVNISNALLLTNFVFDIADSSTPTGVLAILYGFCNSPCDITAQLVVGGVAVGNTKTVAVPVGTKAAFTLGSTSDRWGNILSA